MVLTGLLLGGRPDVPSMAAAAVTIAIVLAVSPVGSRTVSRILIKAGVLVAALDAEGAGGRAHRDVGRGTRVVLHELQAAAVGGFGVLALVQAVEHDAALAVAGLGRAIQGADTAVAAAADSLILADEVDFVFRAVRIFVQVYVKGVGVVREEEEKKKKKKKGDIGGRSRTHDISLDSYEV